LLIVITTKNTTTNDHHLVVEQKFWSLKVSWGDSDIVLLTGVIKLCQTPVNQSQLQPQHITPMYLKNANISSILMRQT